MKIRSVPGTVFWSLYGYFYDGLTKFYPYVHLLDRVITRSTVSADSKVLDLGCGTGNLTLAYLQHYPRLSIDAVDWSSAMIVRARRKVKPYSNAHVTKEDIFRFLERAPDSHYSHVVMVNVVYTIADRPTLWRELHRVIKPGGVVVFANPDRAGNGSIIKEHVAHSSPITLLRPRLVAVGLIDSVISALGRAGTYEFTATDKLLSELADAHFETEKPVERCYGGEVEGIDIIIVATKR